MLLFFSFFLVYLGMFIDTPISLQILRSEVEQNYLLFIFYFFGFYIQTTDQVLLLNKVAASFIQYPFLIILFLLAVEKLAHFWLENKCSTSSEKTDHYQLIIDVYDAVQKKKLKAPERGVV